MQSTARLGNVAGVLGVGTGIMATIGGSGADTATLMQVSAVPPCGRLAGSVWSPYSQLGCNAFLVQMAVVLGAGGAIGASVSTRVAITDLPQVRVCAWSLLQC